MTKLIDEFSQIDLQLSDINEVALLLTDDPDEEMEAETVRELNNLAGKIEILEVRSMLSGKYDITNAIVQIHSGAGGAEAQDWTAMLLRMYLRWAERKEYKAKILDMLHGEEAGIKSVTFIVEGDHSYGYLKAEAGVHRLVRISPFDANKRRHTSFSSISVVPEIDDDIEVKINEDDLKVDTYRSSGAGGQHVNTTDSAVRITHKPTGLVVSCQNERSQHKNRHVAMKVLRGKLVALAQEEMKVKIDSFVGEKKQIEWGSQIRSYVLQPYQMVKDLRTKIEVGDPTRVLDGDIDQFIRGYLLRSATPDKKEKK